jgi:hypothetical protein
MLFLFLLLLFLLFLFLLLMLLLLLLLLLLLFLLYCSYGCGVFDPPAACGPYRSCLLRRAPSSWRAETLWHWGRSSYGRRPSID